MSRCRMVWTGPAPGSLFEIEHRCGRDEHTDGSHGCRCGAIHAEKTGSARVSAVRVWPPAAALQRGMLVAYLGNSGTFGVVRSVRRYRGRDRVDVTIQDVSGRLTDEIHVRQWHRDRPVPVLDWSVR